MQKPKWVFMIVAYYLKTRISVNDRIGSFPD